MQCVSLQALLACYRGCSTIPQTSSKLGFKPANIPVICTAYRAPIEKAECGCSTLVWAPRYCGWWSVFLEHLAKLAVGKLCLHELWKRENLFSRTRKRSHEVHSLLKPLSPTFEESHLVLEKKSQRIRFCHTKLKCAFRIKRTLEISKRRLFDDRIAQNYIDP